MMMNRMRSMAALTVLAAIFMLAVGCGTSTQHVQVNLPMYDDNILAACDMTAIPGNALAASDGLGAVVFGPPEVRDQFAMLRGSGDAFARAEAADATNRAAAMQTEFANVDDE